MTSTPPPPATPPEEEQVPPEPSPPPPSEGPRGGFQGWGRLGATLLVPLATVAAMAWAFEWLRVSDTGRAVEVGVALLLGVVAIFVLFWSMNLVVNQLSERWSLRVRPWVFVGPALLLLGVFLFYPTVYTVLISFKDASSTEWVGLDNYRFLINDPSLLRAVRNTFAWVLVVPTAAVAIGLTVAVLADRLRRGEAAAKSLIFLPMAVSFVGAAAIWGFIYDFRSFGNQTGLLNGLWTALGNDPVAWLTENQPWNNVFLMVVMIWIRAGFAMVLLSAAIKAVPDDLIEAARIDGANEFQIFFRVIIPTIMTTIVVVATTITIDVLKIFDIVAVMTGGQAGTEVIPERMVTWFFTNRNFGVGATIAVLMFVAVIPVMLVNVRRFRQEESIR